MPKAKGPKKAPKAKKAKKARSPRLPAVETVPGLLVTTTRRYLDRRPITRKQRAKKGVGDEWVILETSSGPGGRRLGSRILTEKVRE